MGPVPVSDPRMQMSLSVHRSLVSAEEANTGLLNNQ